MEIQMQISLSDKLKTLPTIIVFAVLSILFVAASLFLFGELMLPLASAALAILFVLENGRRRIFSIAIPLVAIAADLIIRGIFSYLALETTVFAVIIAMFFIRGSKAECSFWLTLTALLFSLFSMALIVYSETKAISLDAFLDYYIGLYNELEKMLVPVLEEAMATAGTGLESIDPALIPTLMSSKEDRTDKRTSAELLVQNQCSKETEHDNCNRIQCQTSHTFRYHTGKINIFQKCSLIIF